MTVIVYRAGIMAADSGSFGESSGHCFARKLARALDGTLYGVAGTVGECAAFLDWVLAGEVGDYPEIRRTNELASDDAIHVLRARRDCDPEVLTGYGVERWVDAPYAVIGSGRAVALGALHAGASAEGAVAAAIAHSNWVRGPIRSISHAAPVMKDRETTHAEFVASILRRA